MTFKAEAMINDFRGHIYPSVLQCQCHLRPQMPNLACQCPTIVGYKSSILIKLVELQSMELGEHALSRPFNACQCGSFYFSEATITTYAGFTLWLN